jgi:hypothetical protein
MASNNIKINILTDHLEILLQYKEIQNATIEINDDIYYFKNNTILINFIENNILYSNFSLKINNKKINIDWFLDSYRLDINKLLDHDYINENLISSPARKYKGNELFFLTSGLLNVMNRDNPYFGAILTLLSYRISEDFSIRKKYLNLLLNEKMTYDSQVKLTNEYSVRWFFSSSATISTILLLDNKISEAKKILLNQWSMSSVISLSSHSAWNKTLCDLNLSLICLEDDKNLSLLASSNAYSVAKNEINILNSCLNPFILYQSLDCKILTDLIQNAIIIIKRLECHVDIPSKYKSIKINEKHEININVILRRFSSIDDDYKNFYLDKKSAINKL